MPGGRRAGTADDPIQLWAILTAFMAVVVGVSIAFEDKPLVILSIILPMTLLLLVITARTTRGGWRWRWGDRD